VEEELTSGLRERQIAEFVEGEQSVNKLAVRVGLSQSALSQHPNKLRRARLVETRRDAQTIYYLCRSAAVQHMLRVLDEIFPTT
jgi:ArsR family transcriptional regulator, virulence genes transcriptional regulator